MKKTIASLLKKSGEKAATVPITTRCWPFQIHQPKMPSVLREKMEKQDNK